MKTSEINTVTSVGFTLGVAFLALAFINGAYLPWIAWGAFFILAVTALYHGTHRPRKFNRYIKELFNKIEKGQPLPSFEEILKKYDA